MFLQILPCSRDLRLDFYYMGKSFEVSSDSGVSHCATPSSTVTSH